MKVKQDPPLLLFDLQEPQRSLRGLWLLIGYYLFAILFGAVLAAPLYWFVEWMSTHVVPLLQSFPALYENGTKLGDYLLGKPLSDYFKRAYMVPLVIGLPWIMWKCRLLSFHALGLGFTRSNLRGALFWAVVGALMLGAVAVGQICFDNAVLKENHRSIAFALFTAASGAILVALLEEIIFRGIVLRIFYTAFGGFWAVVLSSAFYAYTHFRVPKPLVSSLVGDSDFLTGFQVGFWTLFGIVKGFSLIEFLVLFGLGCAIGQVFLKTRTLLPGIGLHAGLVFTMLFYRSFYQTPDPSAFWGNAGFKNGYLPLIVVAVLNLMIYLYYRCRAKRTLPLQREAADSLGKTPEQGA